MKVHLKDTKLNVLGMVQNLILGLVTQLSLLHAKQFQFMK